MCAFYGLIVREVTNVHRNCVCACACVRACVCMCASGLAYVDLREENCILMHNFF